MSDEQTSEVQDETIWPNERLDRAEAEIAAEKERRAAAQAAQKAAALTPEEREANSMRAYGKLDASDVETRKKLLAEIGFNPGWR
jgi:hypothetical protein